MIAGLCLFTLVANKSWSDHSFVPDIFTWFYRLVRADTKRTVSKVKSKGNYRLQDHRKYGIYGNGNNMGMGLS